MSDSKMAEVAERKVAEKKIEQRYIKPAGTKNLFKRDIVIKKERKK